MELNRIYNMDCFEGMKKIPDESVDLVVTSPPYNLGKIHHTGSKRFQPYKDDLPENVYQEQQIKLLKEFYRILKPYGSVMYNHKNRIREGKQISPYEWIFKSPLVIKQELVWFNRSQNFDKCRFYPMTERVYWLSKSIDTQFENVANHHDLFDSSEWPSVGTNTEHKRAFPLNFARWMVACFPEAKISEAHQKELDEKRHSDYKRCLGMAKWCKAEQTYSSFAIYITEHPKSRWANKSVGAGSWIAFWKNREQRWLDIAEKFKPNSTAQ